MKAKLIIVFLIGVAVSAPVFALECVEYVQQNGWADFKGAGAAKNWYGLASGKGYALGNKPMVGSVLVWKGWIVKDEDGKDVETAGHVALTASIVSNTEITVNHANWPADGKIRLGVKVSDVSGGNWTKVKVNDGATDYEVYGFIYPKQPAAKPSSGCLGTTCGDAVLFRGKLSSPKLVRFGASLYSVTDVGWLPLTKSCESATQRFYLIPKYLGNDALFRAVPAPSDICAYVIPMCIR